MSQIGGVLALADALLVHLKDDPLFRITIPSKTQAYLAAGRPILMGVSGDAADLVLQSGAGLVFEPENAGNLCASIQRLLKAFAIASPYCAPSGAKAALTVSAASW